jgi:hypothetical protein
MWPIKEKRESVKNDPPIPAFPKYLNYVTFSKDLLAILSFIDLQNTTIINDSSTLYVQMDLLEVQFYYTQFYNSNLSI